MAVKRKVKRRKKKKGLIHHLVSLGFSNRLAIYILLFLAAGLAGGFYLANEGLSILENAGRMGLPLPDKLLTVLVQLKTEKGKDEKR